MRTRWARRAAVTVVVAALAVGAGCGAAGTSTGASSASSPAPTPAPPVRTPADGVSLAALGVTNGPVARVFVPREAVVSVRVDQANNVALVLPYPRAADLAAFFRRTLPAGGFTITADNPAEDTLTFAGLGWSGTFTGDAQASALLLRPSG